MKKEEYLSLIDEVIAQGPYTDTWDSLCEHPTPKWYARDKFGIFIHWGVYSVPAFGNEWYPRNMYIKGSKENLHHEEKYGTLDKFGYKDFIPQFKAEKFDPKEWAELFKEAGAKFVVPVAEHHDGFQMYASDLCRWNAAEMGPKRDILGELKTEVEKEGMVLGASTHRAEHYWFFNGGRQIPESDVNDPGYDDLYGPAAGISRDISSIYDNPPSEEHMQDWLVRTCEIVDKYQPSIVYFDWWIQQYAWKPYLRKFAAYYYNRSAQWGKETAIDAKFDAYVYGSAVNDLERGQLDHITPDLWQNDTSVANFLVRYHINYQMENLPHCLTSSLLQCLQFHPEFVRECYFFPGMFYCCLIRFRLIFQEREQQPFLLKKMSKPVKTTVFFLTVKMET